MNEATKLPETISLEALKAGNRAEFARLVDTYSTKIYYLALKMLNDPQDAEDVLQDTFLKALRALPEFEGRSSLSTWLFRIAVNEALMVIRKRHPETVSLDASRDSDNQVDSEPAEVIDWCCLPENELLSAEARTQLDKAIEALPSPLRVIFILRDIEGLSIKETAEALNVSEDSVKTRLFRARLKLREDLSKYFAEKLPESSRK